MQRKIKNQIVNAILEDDAEQVRRLIEENGVGVNATFTAQKVTLLMMAARENAINVVRALLVMGADTTIVDYIGRSASDYALKYDSYRTGIALIKEEVKHNVHMGQFTDGTICEENG